MYMISATKGLISQLIKSCTVIEKKKDEGGEESSVLKMILNQADRDT